MKSLTVYANGLSNPPIKVKPVSTKEVMANREQLKTYTFQGTTIRVGDKIVWDWVCPSGERTPMVLKAIFRDKLVQYYFGVSKEAVWMDFGDSIMEKFQTYDGRWTVLKRPVQFDYPNIHKLNIRVIKKN